MNTPATDNILFIDTEFTDLDPKIGELLSIALIKPTGEELYIELAYSKEPHQWVIENVLPHLEGNPVSIVTAREQITAFIGQDRPHLVAYINQLDAVYWYDLFGSAQSHPAHKHPIDFASILFGYGYNTTDYSNHNFLQSIGIDIEDKGRGHHALDDCRFLRKVYYNFFDSLEAETLTETE